MRNYTIIILVSFSNSRHNELRGIVINGVNTSVQSSLKEKTWTKQEGTGCYRDPGLVGKVKSYKFFWQRNLIISRSKVERDRSAKRYLIQEIRSLINQQNDCHLSAQMLAKYGAVTLDSTGLT